MEYTQAYRTFEQLRASMLSEVNDLINQVEAQMLEHPEIVEKLDALLPLDHDISIMSAIQSEDTWFEELRLYKGNKLDEFIKEGIEGIEYKKRLAVERQTHAKSIIIHSKKAEDKTDIVLPDCSDLFKDVDEGFATH